MQSFGDDTLLACIDIEKRHRILQAESKVPSQEENVSDLGEYFKSSSLLSDFTNKENDVDKPKLSDSGTKEENEKTSNVVKYVEDSIIFPKVNSRRNLSSAASASKRNRLLPSQRNRCTRKTNKENVDVNLKEKHRPGTADDTEKCDGSSTSDLCKNKSLGNTQDATSSSGVKTSLAVSAKYERENSEFVILSPPFCTQDRCKLVSWGLPPNILQVCYTNTLNKYLFIYKYLLEDVQLFILCYNFS